MTQRPRTLYNTQREVRAIRALTNLHLISAEARRKYERERKKGGGMSTSMSYTISVGKLSPGCECVLLVGSIIRVRGVCCYNEILEF